MIKFFRHMRQRLLAESKFSKYILYAIGEIVLVVIGILIALQINNWNEGKKIAKQETVYLNRLLSENKQDLATFSENIKIIEHGKLTIENFSEALRNEAIPDSIVIQMAEEYFAYGSIYPIFTSSTSTFEDLSSTGNLQVISNTGLRDKIVKHYAKHKQITERFQIATNWALPLDAPFTLENDIMQFEPSTKFLFPEKSNKIHARELRTNKMSYFSNVAAHYWIDNDAINELRKLIKETSNLILSLEHELL